MSRVVRRCVGIAAVPAVGLVVSVLVAPGRAEPAFHVWLLATLAIALAGLIAATRIVVPAPPSTFDAARTGEPAHVRPASLAKLEREVSMAADTAFDAHIRLRPTLRALSAGLLAARNGVDLDRQPERARLILGEAAWELVRPDRPVPENRADRGIEPAELERAITAFERLA